MREYKVPMVQTLLLWFILITQLKYKQIESTQWVYQAVGETVGDVTPTQSSYIVDACLAF